MQMGKGLDLITILWDTGFDQITSDVSFSSTTRNERNTRCVWSNKHRSVGSKRYMNNSFKTDAIECRRDIKKRRWTELVFFEGSFDCVTTLWIVQ